VPAPNEELARRVAARLAAAGVVRADEADALAERLARGAVTQRDWEAIVEAAGAGGAGA
jgi:hypothetical protein